MKELALLCVRRKELILMLVNYTQVTPRDDLPVQSNARCHAPVAPWRIMLAAYLAWRGIACTATESENTQQYTG